MPFALWLALLGTVLPSAPPFPSVRGPAQWGEPAPSVAGRVYFAAPDGSPRGDGTKARPWDLATALAGGRGGARIEPGDTVLLREGVYRGAFRSSVTGVAGAPVVVRQYPGERAVIDGAGQTASTLVVRGAHSVFWGFELTNSDTARATSTTRSLRPNVVVNNAPHTKYINLVVHDGGVAFYTEPAHADVEIAGCIIYNSGWQGPRRGHGHGLYLKSYTGPLLARDNVIFNQYGYGVHAYTNKGTGRLVNITVEGNVAFNNGTLARQGPEPNILVGGADYASGDIVRDNFTYFSPGLHAPNLKIGYGTLQNGDVVVEGNYVVGGEPLIELGAWSAARLSANTLIGSGSFIRLNFPVSVGHILRANVEQRAPAATKVVVRHNPYEAGRAHVVVYNWGEQRTISADMSQMLGAGERYEVRNVQDLFGAAIVSGRYSGGSITIPLEGVPPPAPVGRRSSPAPWTGPAFDVFLVTRVGRE
jgi:hypothetical protein